MSFEKQNSADVSADQDADFEGANLVAVRPDIYSFKEDCAEFFRWYEYGGKPRFEPLTREALDSLLGDRRGEGFAFTAREWDHFKEWKLGSLRSSIESLQGLVQDYGMQASWWSVARVAADWCRTVNKPNPIALHEAVDGLMFRAEQDAEANGEALPVWYQKAAEIRDEIEENHIGAGPSPHRLRLEQECERLRDLYTRHSAALAGNDTEQADFERHGASYIERQYPVLNELFAFDEGTLRELNCTDESPTP